ncbi:MAG TPA: carboxypeptidase regulatory-like domain-containing protein [Pyrinomonadaceae bacterium]
MKAPRAPRPVTSARTLVGTFVPASFVETFAALALLLLLLAPQQSRAQEPRKAQAAPDAAAPQPTPAPKTVLTGRVVGESGEPIPDVSVSLAPRTSGTRLVGLGNTVGVDESGGFRFEGLDPGLYDVFAFLPGYVADSDAQTGRPTGPYRAGDNVTIRLVKGGVVTGTVTDGQGQPVVSMNVRAVRVRDLDGGAPASPFPSGGDDRTDDRGVYRIYGLRPGLYVLFAGGPNYNVFGPVGSYGEAATFYPSGTRDTAAEVSLRAGQELSNLDIRMRDDPARVVTGTVELPPGHPGDFSVGVNLHYASTGMPAGTAFLSPSAAQRSFSLDNVADGEYDLQATANGREGITHASAPQRVSVRGADVTGLRLALKPVASASGTLRIEPAAEAGRPAPEACKAVRASLLPQETLVTAAAEKAAATPGRLFSRLAVPQNATPDASGSFTVRPLEAGRYRLSVRLFDDALYVRSVQAAPAPPQRAGTQRAPAPAAAAANVPQDLFDIKAGEQLSGLNVRVAEGAAYFAGSVAATETPAGAPPAPPTPFSQLRVHLVPQERERAEETLRYYEAPVAGDGTFTFRNLAPGRYLVIARPFVVEPGENAPRPAALDAGTRALLRREAETANTPVELQPCQRTTDFTVRFTLPAAK